MDPAEPAPARTCPIHGIVIGPLGECVICRRAESDDESDPSGARGALTALALLTLAIVAVMVYRSTLGARPPPTVPVVAAAATDEPDATEDLPVVQQRVREAERRRDAKERKAAVETAMRRVPIRMYTTKECALCPVAKAFLTEKGYAHTEIDVEESPAELEALRALNPAGSVPTIVVGDEVIVGFGPTVVMSAIYRAAAAKRR